MSHHLVDLSDRKLWADGDIEVSPDAIYDHIPHLERVIVRDPTDEIISYNRLAENPIRSTKSETDVSLDVSWNIPEWVQQLDVEQFIMDKHSELATEMGWSKTEILDRQSRLMHEFKLFIRNHMIDTVKTLIYVINTLTTHNQVWGTGRGSSVSSYALYVIGVHDVDSVLYNLDIHDFIK